MGGGKGCNLNIPSSCVQESRPLLATVISSESGLPKVSWSHTLCGQGSYDGDGQSQLQPFYNQG